MRQSAIMVAGAIGIGVGAVVLAGVRLNDAEVVTVLSEADAASGDHPPELHGQTVEVELFRAYQPLLGFEAPLFEIDCPGPLKAVTGATLTCSGRTEDDRTVSISIRVVRVDEEALVWRYEIR